MVIVRYLVQKEIAGFYNNLNYVQLVGILLGWPYEKMSGSITNKHHATIPLRCIVSLVIVLPVQISRDLFVFGACSIAAAFVERH